MNRFLFSFRFSIALSFLFLLASAPPSLSSSSDSKNSDDAPELVRNRLNQLPQILVKEKDHRDAFKTALSMGCACKQAYYAFLNLEMPLYQGWDWNTASLTEESSVVIETKTPFAVADTSKLTSISSLTKIPLGFIQKNISALLILARIRYTIHQYLASIKTPFKSIEKGDLADLLYTYPVYRTEKVKLYQMIYQQRGVSYPERLQKLGVVLSLLEMDKPEQDDDSLRRALRRAHETKTLRSFGKDYSPDMIQRTLNRFHLKTQLIIHLQKLIPSETLSQTLTSLPYDLLAQKTASSSLLTEDQKRLRKKLTQRKKEKKAAENRTARSTKKNTSPRCGCLNETIWFRRHTKESLSKRRKKTKENTTTEKSRTSPQKNKHTSPPNIPSKRQCLLPTKTKRTSTLNFFCK